MTTILIAAITALIVIVVISLRWKSDPIAAAFTGLTSSLLVLAGGLAVQSIELKLRVPHGQILGISFEITEFTVTGTPAPVWITAFLSIAALLAWLAKLISDGRRNQNQ